MRETARQKSGCTNPEPLLARSGTLGWSNLLGHDRYGVGVILLRAVNDGAAGFFYDPFHIVPARILGLVHLPLCFLIEDTRRTAILTRKGAVNFIHSSRRL